MATRWARFARGWLTAVAAVLVAALSHMFHLLFGLGGSAGSMTVAGHHGAATVIVGAASASPVSPGAGWMWLAHALAAVVTIVALRRGERTFWALVELARTALVAVVIALGIVLPPLCTVRVRAARHLTFVPFDLAVLLSPMRHRGPPLAARRLLAPALLARHVRPRPFDTEHIDLAPATVSMRFTDDIMQLGAIGIDLATKAGPTAVAEPLNGTQTVPFYGVHQAGIDTVPQSNATLIALDLDPGIDAPALRRLLKILTSDAARLSQGEAELAGSEPELADAPARLTVTFGFGPGLVAQADGIAPSWLRPLPAFGIDRLDPAWADGDLLLQIAADDALTVAHATRMLRKDSRSFATVQWVQTGFRRAPGTVKPGTVKPGTTMRNLFGQVDGTVKFVPGTPDFERLVWGHADNPTWLHGGTGFVLRRIAMQLDKWDGLDRAGREASVRRTLRNGAPLTGVNETDEPDFDAKTNIGFPVIAEFSHLRRARSENPDERMLRRGYNYDDLPTAGSVSNSGLLFITFQADVDAQFVPIRRRLDALDLLNEWTAPTGSAVFAIPPGCAAGGYIGDTLF